MKSHCNGFAPMQLVGTSMDMLRGADHALEEDAKVSNKSPWSQTIGHISDIDGSSSVTCHKPTGETVSERQDTVRINSVFHNHVTPAFDKGKGAVPAADPETHARLQMRKQQRQKRTDPPSSAAHRLKPLDVRSLLQTGDETPRTQSTKKRQMMCLHDPAETLEKSFLPPLRKQVTLLGGCYGDSTELQAAAARAMSLEGILQVTSPVGTCSSNSVQYSTVGCGGSSDSGSSGRVSRRQNEERIVLRHSTSYDTMPPLDSTFALHARSCLDSNSSRVHMGLSHQSHNRLDSNLPRMALPSAAAACKWLNHEPYQTQLKPLPSPASSDSGLGSPSLSRALVVTLPNIYCTPATPPSTYQRAGSPLPQKDSTPRLEKSLRQGELRRREIRNLFTDIGELSSWNRELLDKG